MKLKNVFGKELLEIEQIKYNELNNLLYEFNDDKIRLLYRGDKLKNIASKLNLEESDIYSISRKIFKIGEKAKDYINSKERIKNVEKEVFDGLFIKINNLRLDDENIEKEFIDYFSDLSNKDIFSEKICRINESILKEFIRDYYCYFLHTTGDYKNESIFISTSKSYDKALEFAPNDENGVIFNYFIVNHFFTQAISSLYIKEHNELIKELNLPFYGEKGIYPDEKEISIKGALFPQFILSIEFIKEEKIIINPHLKNIEKLDDILTNGIVFDQSDFNQEIITTDYKKIVKRNLRGELTEECKNNLSIT